MTPSAETPERKADDASRKSSRARIEETMRRLGVRYVDKTEESLGTGIIIAGAGPGPRASGRPAGPDSIVSSTAPDDPHVQPSATTQYARDLIERYTFIRSRLGDRETWEVFSGAKASLEGGSSLSPALRDELRRDYDEAERILFPNGPPAQRGA